MIQLTELRIGNWVNKRDTPIEIDIECFIRISRSPFMYNPIELTEDILLKCGFSKIPHFTVMNNLLLHVVRNIYLNIGCVGTPN